MFEDTQPTHPAILEKLENKRFLITKDSADVLNNFRQELSTYLQHHPEIVGVIVYGSHTKAKARSENSEGGKSDIDSMIFIDEDLAPYLTPDNSTGVGGFGSANLQQVNETIGHQFKKIFAENNGYSEEQMKDMKFRLISEEKISQDLAQMESYTSKMNQFNQGNGERPNLSERPLDTEIGRIFHLQLGKGLDKYRAQILATLQQLGPLGDQIWDDFFYKEALSFENGKLTRGTGDESIAFQNKREKLYPRTVEDAIKYFGLAEHVASRNTTTSQVNQQ